jgi:UDPglucose 6-dehydrogenase
VAGQGGDKGSRKLSPDNARTIGTSFVTAKIYPFIARNRGSQFEECTRLRIAVIAAGVVGKATGLGLISKGHEIVFYDLDKTKTAQLAVEGYQTASSIQKAVEKSSITMICAPTPTVNGVVNLQILLSISAEVGNALRERHGYHLVVVRSTIPPGTTRGHVIPQIELSAKSKIGSKIGVCHNPEFLREKFALDDFLHPGAVVIGEGDETAGASLESLYSSFGSPITRCSLETSEMVKYASNLFNATKISFFNEIDRACKTVGVKSAEVSRLMPQLALGLREDMKEWGIYGGRPFGGMCLPKDLDAFISFLHTKGIDSPMLSAVKQVNERTANEQKAPMAIVNA